MEAVSLLQEVTGLFLECVYCGMGTAELNGHLETQHFNFSG